MALIFRYFEIAVYALLNFFPFMLLALYPFKDSMRFSKRITGFLILSLSIIQIGLGILAAGTWIKGTGLLSLFSTVLYLVFYCATVKGHPGKKAFFLFIVSNIANLVVVSSKYMESKLFYEFAFQKYRYSLSLCMFLIELALAFPLFWLTRKVYQVLKAYEGTKNIWNYLWMVPATFYLIWYYHLYSSNLSSLQIAMRFDHLLWLTAINAGSILIYFIIFRMIHEMKINKDLSDTNRALEIQKVQYHVLDRRIQESRKTRHDLRHHFRMMNAYIKDQKYEELQKYMSEYLTEYEDDAPLYFCDHYAMNAMLSYYAHLAKRNHIQFEANDIHIPRELGIPDSMITVLVSNLLENAFEACLAAKTENPFIRINMKMDGIYLFLQIKNSSSNDLKKNKKGYFISTKHAGTGIGTNSVEDIVNRCKGKLQFQNENGLFTASVFLNTNI